MNSRGSYFSTSTWWNPEARPPFKGMMHGLNKDKNLCVSFPWVSLYCTARPPRAASSSTDLIAAAPASSCQTTLNKLHESAFVLKIKVMDVRNEKAHTRSKTAFRTYKFWWKCTSAMHAAHLPLNLTFERPSLVRCRGYWIHSQPLEKLPCVCKDIPAARNTLRRVDPITDNEMMRCQEHTWVVSFPSQKWMSKW